MPITISIQGKLLDNFENYNISFHLYEPCPTFNFQIPLTEVVYPGSVIQIFENNVKIMEGFIDRVEKSYSKNRLTQIIFGRNYLGQLIDNYIQNFNSFNNKTISQIANIILASVPVISKRCDIMFDKNIASLDLPENFSKAEPGETYFEFLKRCCQSRGILFTINKLCQIIFTKPNISSIPEYSIIIQRTLDNYVNMSKVLDSTSINDCTNWYSTVNVIGQSDNVDDTYNYNTLKYDILAPLPKVIVLNNSSKVNPTQTARLFIEEQRLKSNYFYYSFPGHSQNGRIWEINKIVSVMDDFHGIIGDYLIYSVNFTGDSKKEVTAIEIARKGTI